MNDDKSQTTTWIIIGIVIVIIVIAIAWYYSTGNGVIDEEVPIVEENNAVLIIDQEPGDETEVQYAKLSQPGFVLILSTNSEGERVVVGVSEFLEAGEYRTIDISHVGDFETQNGSSVSAVIVADNGDGVFSETDTQVLVDETAPGTTAMISDEADTEIILTDEELASMLLAAGYNVNEEHLGDVNGEGLFDDDNNDDEIATTTATTTNNQTGNQVEDRQINGKGGTNSNI